MLSQRNELSGVVSVRCKGVTVERQELLAEKVEGGDASTTVLEYVLYGTTTVWTFRSPIVSASADRAETLIVILLEVWMLGQFLFVLTRTT